MRLHWSGSAIVLGVALVLAAACGKKEQANSEAAPAAEQAAPAAAPVAAAPSVDPCKLLTGDEVKEVLGKDVEGPTPNTTNPTVCEFKVGTGGIMNVAVKVASPEETIDNAIAEMKKRNIAVSEKTGPAQSFFASPGYGMIQINTFQNGKYAIITMLLPNTPDAQAKELAAKLMTRALTKL